MDINSISHQQTKYANHNIQLSTTEKTKQNTTQVTVKLSDAGRQLSINNDTRPENFERMNRILNYARNDPDFAKSYAKNLAHSDFLMAIDVSTISQGGDISVTRYSNGDLVINPSTKASVQKWENEAKQYKADNINLYNAEKEKGTSDIDIITMLMEKNMSLPESFRKQQGSDYL